jgi:hypothetical protein
LEPDAVVHAATAATADAPTAAPTSTATPYVSTWSNFWIWYPTSWSLYPAACGGGAVGTAPTPHSNTWVATSSGCSSQATRCDAGDATSASQCEGSPEDGGGEERTPLLGKRDCVVHSHAQMHVDGTGVASGMGQGAQCVAGTPVAVQ